MCLVTLFTSSHKHGRYLKSAMLSGLGQSYQDFEYIYIDDGSVDNSLEVAKSFNDPKLRVIRLPKQPTIGHLINKSVQEAKGDYWVWIPADDIIDHKLLAYKVALARIHPTDIIYHDYNLINQYSVYLKTIRLKQHSTSELLTLARIECPIAFTGIMIPIPILKKYPFPEHLAYSEDFYWFLQAIKHGLKFRHIPQILHCKRRHPGTLTRQKQKEIKALIPKLVKEVLDD
jgi:glycosyltransferase involved in cell wall biosynthesis